MTSGFRKPVEARPGCTRNAMRVPRELAGFISGPITVRFAVARDGQVGKVQLETPVPDRRIEDVIRSALRACEWRPGADEQGRPIAIWVIMPIRFTASR